MMAMSNEATDAVIELIQAAGKLLSEDNAMLTSIMTDDVYMAAVLGALGNEHDDVDRIVVVLAMTLAYLSRS